MHEMNSVVYFPKSHRAVGKYWRYSNDEEGIRQPDKLVSRVLFGFSRHVLPVTGSSNVFILNLMNTPPIANTYNRLYPSPQVYRKLPAPMDGDEDGTVLIRLRKTFEYGEYGSLSIHPFRRLVHPVVYRREKQTTCRSNYSLYTNTHYFFGTSTASIGLDIVPHSCCYI